MLGAPAADKSPSGHLETVELSQLCHGAQVPAVMGEEGALLSLGSQVPSGFLGPPPQQLPGGGTDTRSP